LLAVQILATTDVLLSEKLIHFRERIAAESRSKVVALN
jgi:phosphoribosylcarboxyaminoimidazole (NCAIR) mutase